GTRTAEANGWRAERGSDFLQGRRGAGLEISGPGGAGDANVAIAAGREYHRSPSTRPRPAPSLRGNRGEDLPAGMASAAVPAAARPQMRRDRDGHGRRRNAGNPPVCRARYDRGHRRRRGIPCRRGRIVALSRNDSQCDVPWSSGGFDIREIRGAPPELQGHRSQRATAARSCRLQLNRPVGLAMFSLAKLPDPHLGPLPTPRPAELASKRVFGFVNWMRKRRLLHRGEVLAAIVADLKAQAADHIAVTGDLANVSLPQEFAAARAWLVGLGDTHDVTVVPGNHDVYVRAAKF